MDHNFSTMGIARQINCFQLVDAEGRRIGVDNDDDALIYVKDELNDPQGMLPQDVDAFLQAVDDFLFSGSDIGSANKIESFLEGLTHEQVQMFHQRQEEFDSHCRIITERLEHVNSFCPVSWFLEARNLLANNHDNSEPLFLLERHHVEDYKKEWFLDVMNSLLDAERYHIDTAFLFDEEEHNEDYLAFERLYLQELEEALS